MAAIEITSGLWRSLLTTAAMLAALAISARAAQPVAPYFNGVFPLSAPGSATGLTTENAFPNLTFVDPIWMTEIPGTNQLLLVGKSGKISRFPNAPDASPAQVTTVLDLASSLQISEDQGLYRLVFHPRFGDLSSPHASDVFVCYSHKPTSQNLPDKSMWRVSRFTWSHETGTIDPESESILIQQYDPHRWHNAGAMCFDNDGFLMITCGDGGGADDQLGLTQKINGGFFGGVLRIDVDNDPTRSHPIQRQPLEAAGKPTTFPASFSQGYGIPNDNPWTGGSVLEEFYAIGLRSPHSASYDPVTGDLWTGDVGQFRFEELNRIRKGDNHQWPYMEGTATGTKTKPTGSAFIGTDAVPFLAYDRNSGNCIIAGPRYRGAKWAFELGGKIIYADNGYGGISSAQPNGTASPVIKFHTSVGGMLYTGISNICTDSSGEVYFLKLSGQNSAGGTIRKLAKTGTHPDPPSLLSATGLFSDTAALSPSAAMIPYQVASELWSDGAVKTRWMILPNDGTHDTTAEQIAFSQTGNWSFPAGTVFVKHFEMPLDVANPSVRKRLETRVMVCTSGGGKYGLTYRWNPAGTDAVLISSGESEVFPVTLQNGSSENRTWSYPSRNDCMQCHTDATGQSLGLRTHQINRMVSAPATGQPVNQLSLFSTNGYLPSNGSTVFTGNLKSSPLDDVTAPLEHRVRSYLDSNCAHCHQPGSSAPFFDARLQTPLRQQGLVNGVIRGQFNLGADGRYIKPGDPSLSAIHTRLASNVPGVAMPPLGRHLVDQRAADLIHDYIAGLPPAEFEFNPVPTARYVRLSALSGSGASSAATAVAELGILDGTGQPIPTSQLSISSVTSEATVGNSALAIDGNPDTHWLTKSGLPFPRQITVDMGSIREISGFEYTPRQDNRPSRIFGYEAHISEDGENWTLMTSGYFDNTTTKQRFDGLLNNRRTRCEIAGPVTPVSTRFDVEIFFDTAVRNFTVDDISVTRGRVETLTGSGHYYVATIFPYSSEVVVSIPENVVPGVMSGNRPSNVVTISNVGATEPVPSFSEIPEQASGAFEMILTFDKQINGLELEDFSVTYGTLVTWSNLGVNQYRLMIVPSGEGDVTVTLRDGAVYTYSYPFIYPSIPMGSAISATIPFATPKMTVEAESGLGSDGFVRVEDPAASGGAYLWVPEGSRGVDNSLDPAIKVSFQVNVPYSGDYQVMGWVRSDDTSSNSFHLGFDGNASPSRWLTNKTPGQTGSGLFHTDVANDEGTPRIFNLTAGAHVLELYAGADGTRIDRLEIVPTLPYVRWLGSGNQSDLPLRAMLEFSTDVTGLEASDFELGYGASITGISGSGRIYTVTTNSPYLPTTLRLKPGAVQDTMGRSNPMPAVILLNQVNTYEQWAADHQVDPSPASDMIDKDGDGIGQLMEYATGLDPNKAERRTFDPAVEHSRGFPRLEIHEGEGLRTVSLTFLRRKGGLPLTYTVEHTSDFIHYDRQDQFWDSVGIDAQWEWITAYDYAGSGMEPSRFVRLKVERSQP